ncbi:IS21 family transposase [Virgibacillus pantothenticus]|uniref:IS21 family transposase n=1 Tax=Virgibacillus pantothenticus TaxID=1473 RepID=UPI001C239696|nr:IS21 family transposase [Virgibacillus pantothenticus]MBU8567921.1 IS21 family transposase [Virgibacillus pantothenticus]MBU8601819.1 IS21 family transposase [Virgibacillus pantothenticus]MBU8635973.1 IS21 family transposase [Virgibacillus pantothenticus]MBU8643657.1 IS21 family transposase [Virgibacillus pantothenticus]MBU8647797.1 IS21 family transposase [Virgibacillus pantothenticus]
MARKIPAKLILEYRAMGLSRNMIAKTKSVGKSSVSDVFQRADELRLAYEDIEKLSDEEVYRRLFPERHQSELLYEIPDYSAIHRELKRVGVTLKLLWQEYKDTCDQSGAVSMGYTKFCKGYQDYILQFKLTNHLKHKPGVTAEVDWSGSTMQITDRMTGEIIPIYLFVGSLPYSQYTYVEPTFDQKSDIWLQCHVNMFRFFGGSAVRLVCDNLKTGVIHHPKEGDIILNSQYEALGDHYMTAIMPAPVRKPKGKASVESAVGKIATAIIASLRNQQFFSLNDLKQAIDIKLHDYNARPFQKRTGSRMEVFEKEEAPSLRKLPSVPYEIADWVYGRKVNLDCHIQYKNNYYSCPYQYVKKSVNLKVTKNTLEVYYQDQRIATHKKMNDYQKYQWSMLPEHLPDQFHRPEWDDVRLIQ